MKTPADVIASLTDTERQCTASKLAAIREWLATPQGQAYVSEVSEQPADREWSDDSFATFCAAAETVAI